jgi:hypothetical protein
LSSNDDSVNGPSLGGACYTLGLSVFPFVFLCAAL